MARKLLPHTPYFLRGSELVHEGGRVASSAVMDSGMILDQAVYIRATFSPADGICAASVRPLGLPFASIRVVLGCTVGSVARLCFTRHYLIQGFVCEAVLRLGGEPRGQLVLSRGQCRGCPIL